MSALGLPTLATVALLLWATVGWLLLAVGQADVWIAVWAAYLGVIGLAAFFGGLRYRSARVGILTAGGLVLTHFVFALLFVSGLVVRRRGAGSS